MATATMALKVTDGTTTVDLIYHSTLNPGYSLAQDWAPLVAPLRRNELGGQGPYEQVVEDIPIRIFGTSAADAYSKANTLNRLLDQAERWWLKKQPVSPVTLLYSPPQAAVSSVTTPLRAVILGRGGDDAGMLTLPPTFNKFVQGYVIDGIRLRIRRRGAWTGASETPITSASSGHATPLLCTFVSSHPISSPVALTWLGFGSTTTPIIRAGYVCVGSQVSDIQVVEAESGTATGFTSVGDSGNKARGNNVLRYTPTGVVAATSGNITIPTTINGPVAVIAAIRNNSGSTTWQVRAGIAGFGYSAATPTQFIDASTAQPQLVLLGTAIAVNGALINLTIQASAASGTLDIDYLIVVNLRDETVAVVAHDAVDLGAALGAGVTVEMDFIFDPTAHQAPVMRAQNAAGSVLTPMTYRGQQPFQTIGQNLYALWASTNGANWQFTNSSAAVLTPTPKVTRYRSYLIPE